MNLKVKSFEAFNKMLTQASSLSELDFKYQIGLLKLAANRTSGKLPRPPETGEDVPPASPNSLDPMMSIREPLFNKSVPRSERNLKVQGLYGFLKRASGYLRSLEHDAYEKIEERSNWPNMLIDQEMIDHVAKSQVVKSPEAYSNGSVDLGALVGAGPFFYFLSRGTEAAHGSYLIDFSHFAGYEHQKGSYNIGTRTKLKFDNESKALVAKEIELVGEGERIVLPDDPDWDFASRLVCSGLLISSALGPHSDMHFSLGSVVAYATNGMNAHPIKTLLWPHVHGHVLTNNVRVPTLLRKDNGAMEVFACLTNDSMVQYMENRFRAYDSATVDPYIGQKDILNLLEGYEGHTSFKDYIQIWGIFKKYVQNYIQVYYDNDADIQKDEELLNFVRRFKSGMQNYGVHPEAITKEHIVDLLTRSIFGLSVIHYLGVTHNWNYFLESDYMSGNINKATNYPSLGNYRMAIRTLFGTNLPCRMLMDPDNYIYVEPKARWTVHHFLKDLHEMEQSMAHLPDDEKRIHPKYIRCASET